jgi:hypothetical protein
MWRSAALLVCGSLLAATAHAQVYKCIDGKGRTVYLQQACPRGMKSTTIEDKKRPMAPTLRQNSPDNDNSLEKDQLVTPESRFRRR